MTSTTTSQQAVDRTRGARDGAELRRAARLFSIEQGTTASPLVERIWRTRSEPVDSFISVAANRWELVVTRQERGTYVSLRGPETRASTVPIPQDAEFFGIDFRPGVFMPGLPVSRLVDTRIDLPETDGRRFWLGNRAWETPNFDDADVFVDRLAREGLLLRDAVVEAAVQGGSTGLSPRSLQRRFLRATGLTQRAFRQIERAHSAVRLLDTGVPILDVVQRGRYSDQAHLTRSLRRFAGETPSQIVNGQA